MAYNLDLLDGWTLLDTSESMKNKMKNATQYVDYSTWKDPEEIDPLTIDYGTKPTITTTEDTPESSESTTIGTDLGLYNLLPVEEDTPSYSTPSDNKSIDYSGYKYRVTSGIGHREAPKNGASTEHRGLDFATPLNTPIKAAPGTWKVLKVVPLEDGDGGGIRIKLLNTLTGEIDYIMHLGKTLVTQGQIVQGGQQIALSGNSGNSTGPHTHWQRESNGQYVVISKEDAAVAFGKQGFKFNYIKHFN